MKWLFLVWATVLCIACGDSSGAERCDQGSCENDGNECTVAACNAKTGMCEVDLVSDGTSCADGAGECEAGECVSRCSSDDCDDENDCTDDRCDVVSGRCQFAPVLLPLPCDFEGAAGICDDGQCIDAGLCENALEDCDDGNECTMDRCDPRDGQCSNSSENADGAPCDGGAGVCASGSCELAPQIKRYTTRCTDVLFENSADIPVDLRVAPASPYTQGVASTDVSASFRLDQGLSELLLGLGIDSTQITGLEVNVELTGAMPAAVDLPSAETLPFTVDFSEIDSVGTSTVTESVLPDGVAANVQFAVGDWTLGIVIDNMGSLINTSLSPDSSGPIFTCGPLVPDAESIRYPQ